MMPSFSWVYLGVKTYEVFLCFVAVVSLRFIMLTSFFFLCFTSLVSVTGAYERLLRVSYVPVKSKLQHPPPVHTRAFDAFSYPVGRECDEISLPGVGHLITTRSGWGF